MFPVAAIPRASTARLAVAAPAYTRTAFVSSAGNDGTAVLNNDALPYLTQDAAVNALAVAYAGLTTTLRYQSSLVTDLTASSNLNTLLTAGLTMRAHDASVWTLSGAISFGSAANALLTISKLNLSTSLTKVAHTSTSTESAGTITGDADTVIALLTMNGTEGSTGSTSGAGASGTGSTPGQSPPGSPPIPGAMGGEFNGNGIIGEAGTNGRPAWNATLAGSGLLSNVHGIGGNGGGGGGGGPGGDAIGGAGGIGGDSDAIFLEDGAVGGNGGTGAGNGGIGGDGGTGGNGSTITKAAGWTISANTLTGGGEGTGGGGGYAGTGTGGAGGVGGAGAIGGAQGASGNTGSSSADVGGSGATGSVGSDGSII